MENGSDGRRSSAISDTELLRLIGQDLRAIYAEVIRQPLPPRIQATLALIDREQKLAERSRRVLPY
ncbi:hypothetical protein [Microvirga makkahensis]|uniref:Anti-sigma factor NepR domain-containing protein n=1 Tax=Microvirga makkahensis TaxID=1128670 RepID=A0A7X3MSK0_9HYPH|nr:hypothetical protein [Microvirga makkahensis]MXQ12220.1 hypothetical protein [Microvirga makkahensis]